MGKINVYNKIVIKTRKRKYGNRRNLYINLKEDFGTEFTAG